MKDFIIENQGLIGQREYLQLSMQISDSISNTLSIRKDLNEVEERVAAVIDTLSDVVYKSEMSDIMTEFVSTNLLKPVVDSLLKNPVLVLK